MFPGQIASSKDLAQDKFLLYFSNLQASTASTQKNFGKATRNTGLRNDAKLSQNVGDSAEVKSAESKLADREKELQDGVLHRFTSRRYF